MKPEVLILDEPTVGLDRAGEDRLMNLLGEISKKGTSIIIATHNMDIVLRYCSRAIVLNYGKVVSDTTPLELFKDDTFLKDSSIEPPKVFTFARELRKNGLDIDLDRIKDTKSLADEIVRVKGVRL